MFVRRASDELSAACPSIETMVLHHARIPADAVAGRAGVHNAHDVSRTRSADRCSYLVADAT